MVNIAYDEFGLFHENAAEYGIVGAVSPVVRRVDVPVAPGRSVSSLVWGRGPVQVVFVHGGAQNAHTWDTVILALGSGLSAVAVDLPGHGHSDWRADGQYSPASLADDLAVVLDSLQTGAVGVVGMSLGGMTAMELAVRHPRLVRRLMMVDITPGVNRAKAKAVLDFVDGPQSFPSFEALLQRTTEHNPTRSESSLRRGILHNAHQLDDGTWQWRYDRGSKARSAAAESESESEADAAAARPDEAVADDTSALMSPLWDDFAAVRMPLMVVRGSVSPVVDDDDITEARRRQPNIVVEVVDGAGHSVQGDRPLELAALVRGFVLQP